MNVIETRQLTRVFGRLRAVDSATIDVPPGTVLGLPGPNGAGKSTLLKLLAGHLRPTSGSAEAFGRPVSQRDPAFWLRAGCVSQARYLPGRMTAAECLRFARTFHPQWDEAKVAHLVNRLELPLDAKIGDLSRGNHVRLQIGLALAHNPELILLDEPTSGLDPVGRRELLDLLIDETCQGTSSGGAARIISDNGPQLIAKDFKEFIRISGMTQQEIHAERDQKLEKARKQRQIGRQSAA